MSCLPLSARTAFGRAPPMGVPLIRMSPSAGSTGLPAVIASTASARCRRLGGADSRATYVVGSLWKSRAPMRFDPD